MMQYVPETQIESPFSGTFVGRQMSRVLNSYPELVLMGEMLRGVPSGTCLYIEAEHLPDFHSPTGTCGDHYFDSIVDPAPSSGTNASIAPWYFPGVITVWTSVNYRWQSYIHAIFKGNTGIRIRLANVAANLPIGGSVTCKLSVGPYQNYTVGQLTVYNSAFTWGINGGFLWSGGPRYQLDRLVSSAWTYNVAYFTTTDLNCDVYLHLERIANGAWVFRASRGGLSWVRVGAYTFAAPFTPEYVDITIHNNGSSIYNAMAIDWVRFNWIYFGV